MDAKFILDMLRRDLGTLGKLHADKEGRVSAAEVVKVIKRWEGALDKEGEFILEEERLEAFLSKPGKLTLEEGREAFEIITAIHQPLIKGRNDVLGTVLHDADVIRIFNKMQGKPLNEGLVDPEENDWYWEIDLDSPDYTS